MNVVSIVEGHGEVAALPVLLRRLSGWRSPEAFIAISAPIRVHRDRFLKRNEEFQRYVRLAADKCDEQGRILILLDADDDCPAEMAPAILERACSYVTDRPISVVIANREYEAWFIAAASSLHGCRGFSFEEQHIDPEEPRDAKGWIEMHMQGRSYGEMTDQPAFSAQIDLALAYEGSRSFRKLCKEWDRWTRALKEPLPEKAENDAGQTAGNQ